MMVELLGGDSFPFLEKEKLELTKKTVEGLSSLNFEDGFDDEKPHWTQQAVAAANGCLFRTDDLVKLHGLLGDDELPIEELVESLYYIHLFSVNSDWPFPFLEEDETPNTKPVFKTGITRGDVDYYVFDLYDALVVEVMHEYQYAVEFCGFAEEEGELVDEELKRRLGQLAPIYQFMEEINMELSLRDPIFSEILTDFEDSEPWV